MATGETGETETNTGAADGAITAPEAVADAVEAVVSPTAQVAQTVGEKTGETVAVAREKAAAATLPDRAALVRGRVGLAAAAAGLVGYGALFAYVRSNHNTAVDVALSLRLQRWERPWFAKLMTAASWPGFMPQNVITPAVVCGAMWTLGFRTEAAFQALAWSTGPFSSALKYTMRRPRPEAEGLRVAVAPLGGSSFPSGHVLQYIGGYGFLAYLAHTLVRDKRVRRPTVAALCGLIALVGPSRIYQGHHWPTDVSASYLLGTSYLIGVTSLYRRVKARAVREAGK